MLQDIAILTGGTVISEEVGLDLESAALEHLGTPSASWTRTTPSLMVGDAEAIKGRVSEIRVQIENTSDYDREKLQERAPLAGGVAVIKVGAATEIEMREEGSRRGHARHAAVGRALSLVVASRSFARSARLPVLRATMKIRTLASRLRYVPWKVRCVRSSLTRVTRPPWYSTKCARAKVTSVITPLLASTAT